MATAFDFPGDSFPADDFAQKDEPWFMEAKDNAPDSEYKRQRAFVTWMEKHAKAVDVVAIPNAGRGTDWERIRRWNEGAKRGALDLKITWCPTKAGDRGVFFAEFKDGKGAPSKDQRVRLNRYYRMGHKCGVYRTREKLLEHLRAAGAPV